MLCVAFPDADYISRCTAGLYVDTSVPLLDDPVCVPCPASTYSYGESLSCTPCPANLTSLPGAGSPDECYGRCQ